MHPLSHSSLNFLAKSSNNLSLKVVLLIKITEAFDKSCLRKSPFINSISGFFSSVYSLSNNSFTSILVLYKVFNNSIPIYFEKGYVNAAPIIALPVPLPKS